MPKASGRILTQRELNRALLARQLLLARSTGSTVAVGAWSLVGGRIVRDAFEVLSKRDAAAVERERAGLQGLHD